ncbi:hypothetical protein GE061_012117 [Apolygus lucorum]|uniref:DNA repair protein RAD51 homolog 3 n=1 Tax=Apolygus lucorum TaxID=248454 RepID=A0A8S9XSK6_APOLU|nr:hypothetical protein GE061_012117 [Apolygus lucorum]
MLLRPLFTLALPDAVIHSLRKGGYRYFEDLLNQDGGLKEKVIELLGKVNYKASDLLNLAAPSLIDTAGQLLQNEALISRIPTFSQSFDRILSGGVPSGSILQVYGGPGSGKTQFLLQLCVNVQLPECFGGLEGASIFIDTDLGFSPLRLTEIAEGAVCHCARIASVHQMEDEVRTFSVETILNRVYYLSVKNHIELIAAVEQLSVFISENPKVKFVAIDSLIFPFLTVNNSLERTRMIYLIVNKLSEIAEKFNIAIVFSNHITTKIVNSTKLLAQALGESLAHRVPQSLLLAKVCESFSAVLSKSSSAPEVVVQFVITKEGIRDLQESESTEKRKSNRKTEKKELQKKKKEERGKKKNISTRRLPQHATRSKKKVLSSSSSESEQWEPSDDDFEIVEEHPEITRELETSTAENISSVTPIVLMDCGAVNTPAEPVLVTQSTLEQSPQLAHEPIEYVEGDDLLVNSIFDLDGLDIDPQEFTALQREEGPIALVQHSEYELEANTEKTPDCKEQGRNYEKEQQISTAAHNEDARKALPKASVQDSTEHLGIEALKETRISEEDGGSDGPHEVPPAHDYEVEALEDRKEETVELIKEGSFIVAKHYNKNGDAVMLVCRVKSLGLAGCDVRCLNKDGCFEYHACSSQWRQQR